MKMLGQRIKQIRKDAKMNQKGFGEEVGMAHAYVSHVETGRRNPGQAVLKSIAARFHVNEKWLLTGQGPPYIALRDVMSGESSPGVLADPNAAQRSDIDRHRPINILEGGNTAYIDMVREILSSKDHLTKEALKLNILTFHQRIREREELNKLKEEVRQLKKSIGTSCDRAADGGIKD